MSKKGKGGKYTKVTKTKGYTRYKGTPKEQKVSGSDRRTGYGYDRQELIKMHLARPIVDRAIDERIKANLISEHKWVMSGGNAGDLEGIDDRITSTRDLTKEQKIQVLNGILQRLGVKAEIVIAEPVAEKPVKPTPKSSTPKPVKKAIPYALLSSKDQQKIKEKAREKKKKEESEYDLTDLARMIEEI